MSANPSPEEGTGLPQPLDMLYHLLDDTYGVDVMADDVTVLYGARWEPTGLMVHLPDGRTVTIKIEGGTP